MVVGVGVVELANQLDVVKKTKERSLKAHLKR